MDAYVFQPNDTQRERQVQIFSSKFTGIGMWAADAFD